MEQSYPTLQSVRTYSDIMLMEENPLYRYEVPKYWLELELLGLSGIFDSYEAHEEPEPLLAPLAAPLPKRASIVENVVSRSLPLFMRL